MINMQQKKDLNNIDASQSDFDNIYANYDDAIPGNNQDFKYGTANNIPSSAGGSLNASGNRSNRSDA